MQFQRFHSLEALFCFGKNVHLRATNRRDTPHKIQRPPFFQSKTTFMDSKPVLWLDLKQAVMIIYEKILKHPQVANGLIGMSLTEFDELYAAFELAYMERESFLQYTRRHKLKRQRAAGAGRKHKYALRDRLLMTLFWLRAPTTYEVLGLLYDLDKTTVEDNLKDVLETLTRMTIFHIELPQPEASKLRSVQELVDVFPDVRLLIDAKKRHLDNQDKDG